METREYDPDEDQDPMTADESGSRTQDQARRVPLFATSVRLPSVLDREITGESEDAFGHRDFARALRDLVESPAHVPPYSIGLLGGWGTGKSSVKELYLSSLRDDRTQPSGAPSRSEPIKPITFNAWRYGGTDVKRALLRHVYIEVGGTQKSITDALFHQFQHKELEARSGLEFFRDIAQRWIYAPVELGVLLLIVALVTVLASNLRGIKNDIANAIALLVVGYVATQAINPCLRKPSSRDTRN